MVPHRRHGGATFDRWIVGDKLVTEANDLRRRPIAPIQHHRLAIGKARTKELYVCGLSTSKSVDALMHIAYDEHILMMPQGFADAVLYRICVLELVDHQIVKLLAKAFVLIECIRGDDEQIVEVERVTIEEM